MPYPPEGFSWDTIRIILQGAIYGALLLLLKWVSKKVWQGIKFAYTFYQERKELKVAINLSWRLWFWIMVSMFCACCVGLAVWIFVIRSEALSVASQSVNKAEYVLDQLKFEQKVYMKIDSAKNFIILHIDSIRK